jgi:hypothetical protein
MVVGGGEASKFPQAEESYAYTAQHIYLGNSFYKSTLMYGNHARTHRLSCNQSSPKIEFA